MRIVAVRGMIRRWIFRELHHPLFVGIISRGAVIRIGDLD